MMMIEFLIVDLIGIFFLAVFIIIIIISTVAQRNKIEWLMNIIRQWIQIFRFNWYQNLI